MACLSLVETALAKALVLAAKAKRWGVVLEIARELQAMWLTTVMGAGRSG